MSTNEEYRKKKKQLYHSKGFHPFLSTVYAEKAMVIKTETAQQELALFKSYFSSYLGSFVQGIIFSARLQSTSGDLIQAIEQRDDAKAIYEYTYYAYLQPCCELIAQQTDFANLDAFHLLLKMEEDISSWVGLNYEPMRKDWSSLLHVHTETDILDGLYVYFKEKGVSDLERGHDEDDYVSFYCSGNRLKHIFITLTVSACEGEYILSLTGLAFRKDIFLLPLYMKMHICDTLDLKAVEHIIATEIKEFESDL